MCYRFRADNEHVVTVMSDCGSDSTFTVKSKPADESHHHLAGTTMTFDQRELGNIASHIRFDFTLNRLHLEDQMMSRSLVLDYADHIPSHFRLLSFYFKLKSSAFNGLFNFTEFIAQTGYLD